MRENQLRETITSAHGHNETPIYTRVQNQSKAKLDHILTNPAAYEAMAETGWIEQNPFIDSDHGVVWIALDNDKIGALKLKQLDDNRSARQGIQDRIRNKNAYAHTHGSYTGVPLRLKPDYYRHSPKPQKGKENEMMQELKELLRNNGYDRTCVQHHSKHKQRIIEDLLRNDVGEENINGFTLADGIKWRNDKKEYWLHTTNKEVANHVRDKGKGLPRTGNITWITMSQLDEIHVPEKTWRIGTRDGTLKTATVRAYLAKILGIPTKEIHSIDKTKDNRDSPLGDEVHEWRIIFKTTHAAKYWKSYGTPWVDRGGKKLTDPPGWTWATGWEAYTERILEMQEETVNIPDMKREQYDRIVQERNTTDQARCSEGDKNLGTSIWEVIKPIMTHSAKQSFGTYGRVQRNSERKSVTATYLGWTTTLSRLLKQQSQERHWNTFKSKHAQTVQKIPIKGIQLRGTHLNDEQWREVAVQTTIALKKAYNYYKTQEIKKARQDHKRILDNWFLRNIDRYLNEVIRPPKEYGGGAEWPTDSYGQIPENAYDRLAMIQQVYEDKHDSRTAKPPMENKIWITELMNGSTTFNRAEKLEIDEKFTRTDLAQAYKKAKLKSAPGPSGIGNLRWLNAPDWLQNLILEMLNEIYTTGVIPKDLKQGMIYPVPKDTNKPCTPDNARPLTMLETGLKLLTSCVATRVMKILQKRQIFAPVQFAFLPDVNILDPIKMVEQLQNEARTHRCELHQVFLDLTQAFDRLEFWASDMAVTRLGFSDKIKNLLNNLTEDSTRTVITKDGNTENWTLKCGIPQGEVLSPLRFIAVMDMLASWILQRALKGDNRGEPWGIKSKGLPRHTIPVDSIHPQLRRDTHTTIIIYCDDICISGKSYHEIQQMVGIISEFMTTMGIPIHQGESVYTAFLPKEGTDTYKNITRSPRTNGDWEGGIMGAWTP